MTLIGPSIQITGDISGNEDVTVHGRLVGSVVLRDHALVIERGSHVEADVRCARATIHGELNGAVTATNRVELGPAGQLTGSVSAPQVVVAEGACLNGHVDMGQRTIAARRASYNAPQTA